MIEKKDRKNHLLKNTIVFAIGSFATKFISFLLIPLYTNILSVNEYGIVDLLYTICTFLMPLFTLNIADAVLRFSLDKDKNKDNIVNIAVVIAILACIFELITIPFFHIFKEYSKYSILFYIYLSTLSLSQIFLTNLKGQEKLKLYSLGNFIYTLLVGVFSIIFLKLFKLGINGYFLAYIISNIVVFIYSIIFGNVLHSLSSFKFDKKLFINMIKYSIVLIPTSFIWWIMNSSDRIMVTNMIDSTANGIYAISYKIPTIIVTIITIFNQAWFFSAVNFKDNSDQEEYTNSIFLKLLNFSTLLAIGVFIILKEFSKIYVASEFYSSWKYVPILVLGVVFQSLSTFIATSYSVEKDNKGMLFSGISGAAINILLNFILIPLYGVFGAAIATSISYIVVFIYRAINTRKYLKIHILNSKCIINYILLLLAVCSVYISNYIEYILLFIILFIEIFISKNTILDILKIIGGRINHGKR